MGTSRRQYFRLFRVFAMFSFGMLMTQLAYVYVARNDTPMLAATGLSAVALTLAMVLEAQDS